MSKLVALVNPNRLQPGLAPVAVEYLASALSRRGVRTEVLDLCHEKDPRRAIREFFAKVKPDLVGITLRNLDDVVFNCFLAGEMRDTIRRVRDAGHPTVIGGSGFSMAPELLLDYYGLAMGVIGEGEEAICALAEGADPGSVPGLIRREGEGFVRNAPACTVPACVKRGRIDFGKYVYGKGRRGSAGVQTKRGCANRCIYCVVPNIEGSTVRLRNPVDIADEMESLAELGMRRIFFADSEFNYPREHAAAVCAELAARKIGEKLTWQAYISPGGFDTDLARRMKEAGCDLAICTLDSGDDSLLERWNKPFRREDVVQCVKACTESGLHATYCLTIGGPGETMVTILDTLTLTRSIGAKVTFGEPPGLRVYPDTPLAEMVRAEGFTPKNPNLRGRVRGNENLLYPVYYLSAGMGSFASLFQAWRKVGELHHRLVSR
ncbi:MAG: B12-binding domain-containing radical SAM protein [Armatimonadota bacterium]